MTILVLHQAVPPQFTTKLRPVPTQYSSSGAVVSNFSADSYKVHLLMVGRPTRSSENSRRSANFKGFEIRANQSTIVIDF